MRHGAAPAPWGDNREAFGGASADRSPASSSGLFLLREALLMQAALSRLLPSLRVEPQVFLPVLWLSSPCSLHYGEPCHGAVTVLLLWPRGFLAGLQAAGLVRPYSSELPLGLGPGQAPLAATRGTLRKGPRSARGGILSYGCWGGILSYGCRSLLGEAQGRPVQRREALARPGVSFSDGFCAFLAQKPLAGIFSLKGG